MKAYLINALQVSGKFHAASTDQKPSVVDLDEDEFYRLEEMGYVRKPTDTEVKLHGLLNVEDAEVVSDKPKRGRKAKVEGDKPEGDKPEGDKPEGSTDEDEV